MRGYYKSKGYYIPDWFGSYPNPESEKGMLSLPENQICEMCSKPAWSCYCFAEFSDSLNKHKEGE